MGTWFGFADKSNEATLSIPAGSTYFYLEIDNSQRIKEVAQH